MALADFQALRDAVENPAVRVPYYRQHANAINSALYMSCWLSASAVFLTRSDPPGAATPGAAAVCTVATSGAMQVPAANGRRILVSGQADRRGGGDDDLDSDRIGASPRLFFLVDRLSQMGGLLLNITTVQTTNLPTAALTRYTSGAGVMMGFELAGTTTVNFSTTVSYTNEAGVAGRTTTTVHNGGSGRYPSTMYTLNLQSGDLGVKSIESFQISASSGAGANGVLFLYKPLAIILPDVDGRFEAPQIAGFGEEILPGACLQLIETLGGSWWANDCMENVFDFGDC